MSFDAMKKYKQMTKGLPTAPVDLWGAIFSVWNVYSKTKDYSVMDRLEMVYNSIDYEVASIVFKCLITDESIELEQIQDAMFRSGWRPVAIENSEFCQPWPLVMVDLANKIDEQLSEVVKSEKK
jgi:hypothetical protein